MNSNQLTLAKPSDLELAMTRAFDAPARLVFEAWTSPEHVPYWLGRGGDTMPVCEIDLKVGGAWRYVWDLREGGQMAVRGVFLEVEPLHRLVSTEEFEGDLFEVMGGGTVNTLVLEEQHGRTTMTLTVRYPSREARDSALATGMEAGVAESFDRLAALLLSHG